jgi:dCMP deaminase
VGAVLVRDRRIIATGYNGAPTGFDHCDDVGHMMEAGHCVHGPHAEQNALMQVARDGGRTTIGSTLYCTHYPCVLCAKLIIQAGTVRVVCGFGYWTLSAETFLRAAGIEVVEVGE